MNDGPNFLPRIEDRVYNSLRVECTHNGAVSAGSLRHQGVLTMNRSSRLHLVGRITYYVGWVALLCGGLVHLNIAKALFAAMSLTKRNLFEVSVACFVICVASEVRAIATAEKDVPTVVNRPVAA